MSNQIYLSNPTAENIQQEAFWQMLDNPHEPFIVAGIQKEQGDFVEGIIFVKLDPFTADKFRQYLQRRGFDYACAPQTFPDDEKIVSLDRPTFDTIWPQLHEVTEEGMTPRDSIVKMIASEN